MAVTATPIFVQTPKSWKATLSLANTNRDGSGSLATILTAGANGSLVDHIDITAGGTVTTGVVRLYVSDGSTVTLWKEILVTATTPSTSVAVWSASIDCSRPENRLPLTASTYLLRASTHNAETFYVHAFGGDL